MPTQPYLLWYSSFSSTFLSLISPSLEAVTWARGVFEGVTLQKHFQIYPDRYCIFETDVDIREFKNINFLCAIHYINIFDSVPYIFLTIVTSKCPDVSSLCSLSLVSMPQRKQSFSWSGTSWTVRLIVSSPDSRERGWVRHTFTIISDNTTSDSIHLK